MTARKAWHRSDSNTSAARAENQARTVPTQYGIQPGFNGALAGGCQFIEGEDFIDVIRAGGDPHCGAPRLEGEPYCREHHHRAFAGVRPPPGYWR